MNTFLFLCLVSLPFLLFSISPLSLTIPLSATHPLPLLPLLSLSPFCPSLSLLLDTGSSSLWLSDTSCTGCPSSISSPSINCLQSINTTNLIPKQIHYATGWVKGYEVEYELCQGVIVRMVCVVRGEGVKGFGSDGVLGVGGEQSGKEFMKKFLENNEEKRKGIGYYNGKYSKKLVIGSSTSDMILQQDLTSLEGRVLPLQADKQWNINLLKVTILSETLCTDIEALLDTGSQLLSLPSSLYNKLLTLAQITFQTTCQPTSLGLSCHCANSYSPLLLPSLTLHLTPSLNLTLPPTRYTLWRSQHCLLLITHLPIFHDKLILGIPFFNEFPTFFNFEKDEVEIVELDHGKLIRAENANLVVMLGVVIGLVVGMVRVGRRVWEWYDEPGKFVI